MHTKFAIFIVMVSILTMAVYSSSANFVSAETNCYTSGEKRVCITTSPMPTQSNRDILPSAKALVLCDKDGTNCTVHVLDKVSVVTPEVKNAIKNAQIANPEMQGTNSDSHEGGIDNNDTRVPMDFGRLQDNVITNDENKEGINDTKVPKTGLDDGDPVNDIKIGNR